MQNALVILSLSALLAGCAAMNPSAQPARPGDAVCDLGEPFKSRIGEINVIRVQDEYRLFKCEPTGPIAGCYEDIMIVPRAALSENPDDGISWNQWLSVPNAEGLKVMFLTPTRIVFRQDPTLPK